jgi:hypothetical protein
VGPIRPARRAAYAAHTARTVTARTVRSGSVTAPLLGMVVGKRSANGGGHHAASPRTDVERNDRTPLGNGRSVIGPESHLGFTGACVDQMAACRRQYAGAARSLRTASGCKHKCGAYADQPTSTTSPPPHLVQSTPLALRNPFDLQPTGEGIAKLVVELLVRPDSKRRSQCLIRTSPSHSSSLRIFASGCEMRDVRHNQYPRWILFRRFGSN